MAYVPPFCSKQISDHNNVYHLDNRCTEGNNIEDYNLIAYSGHGRILCSHCAKLGQLSPQISPYDFYLSKDKGELNFYLSFFRK